MGEVSIGLALLAGVVSFLSPCVLALVPVYLAFLGEAALAPTGPGTTAGAATSTRSVLPQALLFVAGFTLVFVVLGTSIGLVGSALFRVNEVRVAAGAAVVALGVVATGAFGPVLDRLRIGLPADVLPAARSTRSVALGALVAVGWTPCIGAVLGAIFMMGASTGSAPAAAVLLTAYSLGMALPFLAAAVALPRMRPALELLRRHEAMIRVFSGLFIVLVGVLIMLNAFSRLASFFTFVL